MVKNRRRAADAGFIILSLRVIGILLILPKQELQILEAFDEATRGSFQSCAGKSNKFLEFDKDIIYLWTPLYLASQASSDTFRPGSSNSTLMNAETMHQSTLLRATVPHGLAASYEI